MVMRGRREPCKHVVTCKCMQDSPLCRTMHEEGTICTGRFTHMGTKARGACACASFCTPNEAHTTGFQLIVDGVVHDRSTQLPKQEQH